MLSITSILLSDLWCWSYSLFAHILVHEYATYGVVVQEIDWGLWLFLYIERVCWPWWQEVKGWGYEKYLLHNLMLGDAWKHRILGHMLMMLEILMPTLSYLTCWWWGCSCSCHYDIYVSSIILLCCIFLYGAWWLSMTIMVLLLHFWHSYLWCNHGSIKSLGIRKDIFVWVINPCIFYCISLKGPAYAQGEHDHYAYFIIHI